MVFLDELMTAVPSPPLVRPGGCRCMMPSLLFVRPGGPPLLRLTGGVIRTGYLGEKTLPSFGIHAFHEAASGWALPRLAVHTSNLILGGGSKILPEDFFFFGEDDVGMMGKKAFCALLLTS